MNISSDDFTTATRPQDVVLKYFVSVSVKYFCLTNKKYYVD